MICQVKFARFRSQNTEQRALDSGGLNVTYPAFLPGSSRPGGGSSGTDLPSCGHPVAAGPGDTGGAIPSSTGFISTGTMAHSVSGVPRMTKASNVRLTSISRLLQCQGIPQE